jgi:5-methylcytosine-specific restriction protein A
MLKVGPHEVLQIGQWSRPCHIVVDRDLVPQALRARASLWFSGDLDLNGKPGKVGYYASNPGTEVCKFDFPDLMDAYRSLAPAHRAIIQRAAHLRRHGSTVRSHSGDLLTFVGSEAGRQLEQPAYFGDAASDATLIDIFVSPDEVSTPDPLFEGAVRRVTVNAYERSPEARRKCIEQYGTKCFICRFDFGEVYGEVARGYIHVHHLKPLSEIGAEYTVDATADLRPVCPNCHAVLHRREPPHTIEEVRALLKHNAARVNK